MFAEERAAMNHLAARRAYREGLTRGAWPRWAEVAFAWTLLVVTVAWISFLFTLLGTGIRWLVGWLG